MAQGKMKVKAKLPAKAKAASMHRGASNKFKSKVGKNKKAKKMTFDQKLQQEVTKEIAKNIENETRGLANKFGDSAKIDTKKKK